MVASLRLAFPRTEAASSHCLRLTAYSLLPSECLTLELVMRMTRLGSAKGTGVASRDLGHTSETRMPMVVKPRGLISYQWVLPAVNEQGMLLPAEDRHKLIHNATRHPSVAVFCLLTSHCFGHSVSIICGNRTKLNEIQQGWNQACLQTLTWLQLLQKRVESHLQRGRAGQTSSQGDTAGYHCPETWDRRS